MILLKERYEKAGREVLLYGIGLLVCAVLFFGWLRFYWPDFCINIVMVGGPWCTAMFLVNLIRCATLKHRIKKLVLQRS